MGCSRVTSVRPEAKVSSLAGNLVVQSRKRSFQVYAAEVIQSLNGIDVLTPEYFGVSGQPADASHSIDSGMNVGGGGAWGGG